MGSEEGGVGCDEGVGVEVREESFSSEKYVVEEVVAAVLVLEAAS